MILMLNIDASHLLKFGRGAFYIKIAIVEIVLTKHVPPILMQNALPEMDTHITAPLVLLYINLQPQLKNRTDLCPN